jgi:hypothetical protein
MSALGSKYRNPKTHCVHGHEFTVENTRVLKSGTRICRACKREWYQRNKGLKGRPKNNKNQNTDKTHCVRGHEFTEANTYVKGEHRVCRECHREDQRRIAKESIGYPRSPYQKRKRKARLKVIGWTPELFESTFVLQEGKCAICKKDIVLYTKQRILKACADHEHTTPPKPRGILCINCNLGIGNLQEDIEIMKSAIEYMEKWG